MFKKTLLAAAAALLVSGVSAQAAPIFSDNFNSETQGLNYTGFANWTVTSGSVDLIGTGFFDFYPGHGNYVDLDGTTANRNPAGQITTNTVFGAGSYTLSFLLGGSTRGDTNTVTVALGNFSQNFTLASNAGLILETLNVSTTGGALSFTNLGESDNLGLILDDVSLSVADRTAVPEPVTLSLFGAGLAGAAALRRRKKAKQA